MRAAMTGHPTHTHQALESVDTPPSLHLQTSRAPALEHRIELIGAFESTFQPAHDIDVLESSGHTASWQSDLALVRTCGIRRLRYPVRWHRVEATQGYYDWSGTDAIFDYMRRAGLEPIVDLVHHTS